MSGARARTRTNPTLLSSNPPFSAHILAEYIFGLEACVQETGYRRKCRYHLVEMKRGVSPLLGGVGKLRNQCRKRWQSKLEQSQRRYH